MNKKNKEIYRLIKEAKNALYRIHINLIKKEIELKNKKNNIKK